MLAVLTAIGAIAALTAGLATMLVVANRRLHVAEDPRIDDVEELLPHANCGACGYPGCRPFAEALVAGQTNPAKCSVSTSEGHERVAAYLGMEVGVAEKRVARLACAGGTNVARNRAHYDGLATCAAATKVAGGGKSCYWGCLGLADCEVACDFDAITMNEHGLPVVDADKCTACGDCVVACPKDLFSIHPVSHQLWVNCRSLDVGDEILHGCEVACTACGRCAADAPAGLVRMANNLPVVDYTRPHQSKAPIERCPTGAIVWLDEIEGVIKGPAAKKILRHGQLQDVPS